MKQLTKMQLEQMRLQRKVTTFDINSMLHTFIEIEKSQMMKKILTSKSIDREKLRYLGEKSPIGKDEE